MITRAVPHRRSAVHPFVDAGEKCAHLPGWLISGAVPVAVPGRGPEPAFRLGG